MTVSNDTVLTLGLSALAIYFSVLIARGLAGYLLFLRVRPTALLTWPMRRPAHFVFMLALGLVAAAVAVMNSTLGRPFHHVYSQGVMAVYFMVMVPLSARIQVGLYRDGVWADSGFLRYDRIARLAFRETPEIVLILMPRGRAGLFRLPVPSSEYENVRLILEEKIRGGIVNVEKAILGL